MRETFPSYELVDQKIEAIFCWTCYFMSDSHWNIIYSYLYTPLLMFCLSFEKRVMRGGRMFNNLYTIWYQSWFAISVPQPFFVSFSELCMNFLYLMSEWIKPMSVRMTVTKWELKKVYLNFVILVYILLRHCKSQLDYIFIKVPNTYKNKLCY